MNADMLVESTSWQSTKVAIIPRDINNDAGRLKEDSLDP